MKTITTISSNFFSHFVGTIICVFVATFCASSAFAVDLEQIKRELEGDGAYGWVHGSVDEYGLFVFTYRNPKDFFDSIQMSMVATNENIKNQMVELSRHDRIRIRGQFLDNPSPQKHIAVNAIEMVTKYDPAYDFEKYDYATHLPDDLLSKNSETFLVHAVAEAGHILVLEYQDSILPLFVRDSTLTKDLYRNDIVEIKYFIQRAPNQPVHIRMSEGLGEPLKVIQSIKNIHGVSGGIEGALIMFQQSPDIRFNVFAIQQELSNGLKRQFTIVNFDDVKKFENIRAALQAAWDKFPGEYLNARNKLVSKRLRVKATGVFNEVSPSQANPQILVDDVSSLEILEN